MVRINYKHSEETKKKIGLANSIALKGRKLSLETRRKMSESRKGEKGSNWRGGISNLEIRAGRPKPERCEICLKKSVKICFDHNHKTGQFRGWICTRCNVTLGMIEDDIYHLEKLKKYLITNGIVSINREMQQAMYIEAITNKELLNSV